MMIRSLAHMPMLRYNKGNTVDSKINNNNTKHRDIRSPSVNSVSTTHLSQ